MTTSKMELCSGIALEFCRSFDPTAHGLEPTFRLTDFADIKKHSCKLSVKMDAPMPKDCTQENKNCQTPKLAIGIDVDSSVVPLPQKTMNFLHPVVEDPYMMGKIACALVLSELYAMGITDCHNMRMLLAVSTKMTQKEKDLIMPLMATGFKDCALEAGTEVIGERSTLNPWCIIGGVASSMCQSNEFIVSNNAKAADLLVLTKPLGNQVAVTVNKWLDQPEHWNRIKKFVSEDDVCKAYQRAMYSMCHLNRSTAARLMHKYEAGCATTIGDFGLLRHAEILAANQKRNVSFMIYNLPIIKKMADVDRACGNMFQLLQGKSVEMSGGLLICLPREQAAKFCKDLAKQDGYQAWIVGVVDHGNKTAHIVDNPRVIEAPVKDEI